MSEYGRSKKLVDAIDGYAGRQAKDRIIDGLENLTSKSSAKKKAEWALEVVRRMESFLDRDTCIKIREACACPKPKKLVEKMKVVYAETQNLSAFTEAMRESGQKWLLYDNGTLYASYGFKRCVCGMINASKKPVPKIYCHCSKGHLRSIFEDVFKQPVHIEVMKTLMSGDDDCTFAISLSG